MGYPLWDMLSDLAIARGLRGANDDSNSRYVRGRVAAVLWIPGLAIALTVGGWTDSWVAGVAVLIFTLVVMVIVAYGPRRLASAVRRRASRPPAA